MILVGNIDGVECFYSINTNSDEVEIGSFIDFGVRSRRFVDKFNKAKFPIKTFEEFLPNSLKLSDVKWIMMQSSDIKAYYTIVESLKKKDTNTRVTERIVKLKS